MLLAKYDQINEAAGVSITIHPNGETEINACTVMIKKNRLSFDKKITGLTRLEEMVKHLPAKMPLALNLSGKGILQKQIDTVAAINHQNFDRVLPNADIEDFYVQQFISGAWSFVSVIRKVEADKWVHALKDLTLYPLQLSLGPFAVQHIERQLNVYGEELIFDGHTITRDEQLAWAGYTYHAAAASPFMLKVESEVMHEKLLIPYAAAFQLLLADKIKPINAAIPQLEHALRQNREERKFKTRGFLILAVFFVLLFVNFLLFSWLNSENGRLSTAMSRSAQSTSDVQQLYDGIAQKESLLKILGWEDNIAKSGLIDQLASLLPAEINWREAAVDPVDPTAGRNQKTAAFYARKIRITGNSEKIIPVNEWIARIKTIKWVKNVQLDSYTFNNELNTGQFTILINY